MTTTPTHTRESLEAMPARELDAVVAEVVFGHRWFDCTNGVDYSWCSRLFHPSEAVAQWNTPVDRPSYDVVGTPRPYSTTWDSFGLVAERMRELGFTASAILGAMGSAAQVTRGDGMPVYVESLSLPRATSIAAILAVQGAAP